MKFTTVLAVSLFSAVAVASPQYGGPPPPPPQGASSTSTAPSSAPSAPPDTPGNMNINVAAGGSFVFSPANITAPNGTIVTFWFPKTSIAHSVTQSSFAEPCTYLAATSSTPGGFDTGLANGVQFSINITNDQSPIWFHCKQVTHCGLGMVGSINAPLTGNNTFTAFQQAAIKIGSAEVTETDNGPVTGGVNAVATATPAATATGSAPSTSGSRRLFVGSTFGLVAAAIAFILV